MLAKFNSFLASSYEQFKNMTAAVGGTPPVNGSPANANTNNGVNGNGNAGAVNPPVLNNKERELIANFQAQVEQYAEMATQGNLPKQAISYMQELVKMVNEIHFDDMTMENQAWLRRNLETEIPHVVQLYLSVPKAHAVSVVLENGKTAKANLIDNINEIKNKLSHLWNETVEEKTALLLKKKQVQNKVAKRVDFFDL